MARDSTCNVVYVYRCALVKDRKVKFNPGGPCNPTVVAELIRNTINKVGQPDREHVVLVMTDPQNVPIGVNIVSVGSVSSSSVCAREVFKPVIVAGAARIIIGHNHPCGNVAPSGADRTLTINILVIAMLLGVTVLDHVIVNTEGSAYFSFVESYMLTPLEAKAKEMLESLRAFDQGRLNY